MASSQALDKGLSLAHMATSLCVSSESGSGGRLAARVFRVSDAAVRVGNAERASEDDMLHRHHSTSSCECIGTHDLSYENMLLQQCCCTVAYIADSIRQHVVESGAHSSLADSTACRLQFAHR